jgi:hypothetical protein
LLNQVEECFVSYKRQRGKKFRITGTGGPKKALKFLKTGIQAHKKDKRSRSIEIHGGFHSLLHFTQGLIRETADSLGQFCAVQRGHLMTHGNARLRETSGPAGKLNDGRSALSLG